MENWHLTLFKLELQQNHQIRNWSVHEWMKRFHVDIEISTGEYKRLVLNDDLCKDDFNLVQMTSKGWKWFIEE